MSAPPDPEAPGFYVSYAADSIDCAGATKTDGSWQAYAWRLDMSAPPDPEAPGFYVSYAADMKIIDRPDGRPVMRLCAVGDPDTFVDVCENRSSHGQFVVSVRWSRES